MFLLYYYLLYLKNNACDEVALIATVYTNTNKQIMYKQRNFSIFKSENI
jgi:hypothetical protein